MPNQTEGLADEWQRLLAEWEAAMAAYRTALAADGADSPEASAAERRLTEIKQKMDGVVAAGKADRRSRARKEDLVARVIDLDSPDPTAGGAGDGRSRGR